MTTINIKIPNLEKMKAAFASSPKVVMQQLNKAIEWSIYKVAKTAYDIAPRQTSNMRKTILSSIEIGNLYAKTAPSIYNRGFDYAYGVHEGTSRWPIGVASKTGERRFLIKGAEMTKRDIEDRFEQAGEEIVNIIAKNSK